MSIGNQLARFAKIQPNKPAIYFQEETITYIDFYKKVQNYKNLLQQHKKNDSNQKIALFIGNEPAFLEVYFAVITLGWIAIPFDIKWSKIEAIRIMEMADPDMIIASPSFQKRAHYHFPPTFSTTDEQNEYKMIEQKQKVYADNPFYLGFTSGSTGQPKGFIRNHTSWLSSFIAGEEAFHYGKNDIILAPGPLCHSLSLFGATHALHIGASFYLTASFLEKEILQIIRNQKATIVYAVPTMLSGLARLNERVETPITFLSSGAKLHPAIKKDLTTVFPNSSIYEYYGASELSYVTYTTSELAKKYPESVGKPFPGVVISIRNDKKEMLPVGQIGDVFIQSKFLFTGYVKNEEATKQVLSAYGATIGDLGYLNEEGVLTIIGRKNNMIISGGQNVYPEEVEKIIKAIPDVKEAVVTGIPDAHWGQKVIAFIQWKHTKPEDVKQVKAHCKQQLTSYKRPRKYYTVEDFPYTETGKIARNTIEKNLTEWIQ